MKSFSKFLRILKYQGPLILICSYIFYQSSQEAVVLSYYGSTNYFLHKLAHVVVYSLVFIFGVRAFQDVTSAISFGIFYGITDELHQLFVPTRTGSVIDILIDTGAILSTFFLIKKFKNYLPRSFMKFLRVKI